MYSHFQAHLLVIFCQKWNGVGDVNCSVCSVNKVNPWTSIWVHSLGWEDPLEEKMATHCSILTWRIPWTEEPGGLQSMGSQRVRHD